MHPIVMYMYLYFGCGILVGSMLSIIFVWVSRRMYPLMELTFVLRGKNLIATINKIKQKVDKKGHVSFWGKPTLLFSGFKAIMSKGIIRPPIKYEDMTLMDNGQNLAVSFSPTRNIYLPVEMDIDDTQMKMIPRFDMFKTWFKQALIDLWKNKLLKPPKRWELLVPIATSGFVIIFMLLLIIVMRSVPESMNTITNTFGDFVTRMELATGTVSQAAGSATQVATPTG